MVGSEFTNNTRKSECFISANYLILDIDDCPTPRETLAKIIQKEPDVMLGFISPGGEGIKLLFKFQAPCEDMNTFKAVYQAFSREFAERINLAGSIDFRTCDATRACFLCHDPRAYINQEAETINWQVYVKAEEPTPPALPEKTETELDTQKLQQVMQRINPNHIPKKQYNGYVPEPLLELENEVRRLCTELQMTLLDFASINYGKKVMIKKGHNTAEVNIFYGKKGFSVVRSPKRGNDPELAEILFSRISDLLFRPVVINTSHYHLN